MCLKPPPRFKSGDGVDELHGHNLVVLHAHLCRDEHAPCVLLEVAQNVDVKLHDCAYRRLSVRRAFGVQLSSSTRCARRVRGS